jgi:hypothetical protein
MILVIQGAVEDGLRLAIGADSSLAAGAFRTTKCSLSDDPGSIELSRRSAPWHNSSWFCVTKCQVASSM